MDILLSVHLITSAREVATWLYLHMTNLFVHQHTPDSGRSEIMYRTSYFLWKTKVAPNGHICTSTRPHDQGSLFHKEQKVIYSIYYGTTFNVVCFFTATSQGLCFKFLASLQLGMSSITQGMVTSKLNLLQSRSSTIKTIKQEIMIDWWPHLLAELLAGLFKITALSYN